ncbi:MAG: hypothetical protein IKM61_10595 [Eubacteriaceae bacterium]|nr:hypothetical protein [Eubacteriaceae bacterium]
MTNLERFKKIQKFFRMIIFAILAASFLFERGTTGREILNNSVKIILPAYLIFQFAYLYKIRDEL